MNIVCEIRDEHKSPQTLKAYQRSHELVKGVLRVCHPGTPHKGRSNETGCSGHYPRWSGGETSPPRPIYKFRRKVTLSVVLSLSNERVVPTTVSRVIFKMN